MVLHLPLPARRFGQEPRPFVLDRFRFPPVLVPQQMAVIRGRQQAEVQLPIPVVAEQVAERKQLAAPIAVEQQLVVPGDVQHVESAIQANHRCHHTAARRRDLGFQQPAGRDVAAHAVHDVFFGGSCQALRALQARFRHLADRGADLRPLVALAPDRLGHVVQLRLAKGHLASRRVGATCDDFSAIAQRLNGPGHHNVLTYPRHIVFWCLGDPLR